MARKQIRGEAAKSECVFCAIQEDESSGFRVYEDENVFVFLDHRPLFPGHCLLITRRHIVTLEELSPSLVHVVFEDVRMVAIAVQRAMKAEGTFVAINNIVSQSVPHFHVHIVPRKKGDGLRGFFWPRKKYVSNEEAVAIVNSIRNEIVRMQSGRDQIQ